MKSARKLESLSFRSSRAATIANHLGGPNRTRNITSKKIELHEKDIS